MIRIKNVTKDYGSNKGVFDLSFEVQDQETFGLLGMEGAGKTTLLQILMGFSNLSGVSLIFSISEKAKSFTMNCWNFSKKQKRKAGAVKSFSIRHPILPVFMFRLFIKYLITRTVPLQPLNRFMMMYRKPSKNRSLWM